MDATSTGITPVMNVGNDGGFGGNGAFFWIFALLVLAGSGFGGFGGFGGNRSFDNLATSAQVDRGFDTQNMMANQRENLSAITSGTAQAVAATNQTFHDTLSVLNDKYSELQRDVAGLAVGQANALANQNECCCSTKMLIAETGAGINAGIAQNRYEAAMNTAAINATTTAQTQKILDAMAQNKIESLQAQVNQLQLAQATNGMLRFPNSWAYGAGQFPPIFGGCCGQQNI